MGWKSYYKSDIEKNIIVVDYGVILVVVIQAREKLFWLRESAGLREELGFTEELEYAGVFHYTAHFDNGLTENELDHVLIGNITQDAIEPNPDEVADIRWIPPHYLVEEIRERPQLFTPWLSEALGVALQAYTHSVPTKP